MNLIGFVKSLDGTIKIYTDLEDVSVCFPSKKQRYKSLSGELTYTRVKEIVMEISKQEKTVLTSEIMFMDDI